MARVIDTVLTAYDLNGGIYKRIPLTKEGILNECINYYLDLYSKNYTKFIVDIMLLHKIFNYYDLSHVSNIEEVQRYRKLINTTYDKLPTFNKKYSVNALLYSSTLELVTEFDIKNQTKVEELNFETIDIAFQDDQRYMWLRSYPLIPEFINNLCSEYKYIIRTGSSIQAMLMSIICDEYINALNEKKEIDSKYDELIDEINQMCIVSKSRYFKEDENGKTYYNKIKNSIINTTYIEPTYYNNIDLYCGFVMGNFLKNRDLDFFEKLHKIILKADSSDANYKEIICDIDKLLEEKNLVNERLYLTNLVNINNEGLVVSFIVVHFYAFYVSEEYEKLVNEANGNQRTLD